MKHIKKTVSRFVLLGLSALCGFFAFSQLKQHSTPLFAQEESSLTQKRVYTEADFADEEEVDYEQLGVKLIESTTTETSQSLNFSFQSKTLVAFTTAKKNYIVNITDPNFTGEPKEPVASDYAGETIEVEDSTDAGKTQTLPLLEGTVIFVIGGQNKDVYLPSTLTRAGKFVVKVTSIAANCVTVDGSQYNGKNAWIDPKTSAQRITSIHIPSTVETVEAGAFTGVPASGVSITYEGSSIPSGFEAGWTDMDVNKVELNSTIKDTNKNASVGGDPVTDIPDEHGRPVNFVLGCQPDGVDYVGQEYDRPLVIEFEKVTMVNGVENRQKVFDELPLETKNSPYDSVGKISAYAHSRLVGYKLNQGETIDDTSIKFHNIMKFVNEQGEIITGKRYFAKPKIAYSEKLDLSRLVTFKASYNSTFVGYSMFSLSMDKNLSITSDKYPEPHSLYLDVKPDIYENNKAKIAAGTAVIRYSLYNLYSSFYHFVYEGKDGNLKDITIPISSVLYNQTLNDDKDNKVSVIIKNSDVADDFSADKVRTFELVNITIQMDIFTTSDSGSQSKLGKSEVSYKFAYITVASNEKISVFSWDLFLIFFFIGFAVVFAVIAYVLYKYKKEKYKNDEFRRVNDKKYLRKAIIYGLGSLVIAAGLMFIFMRAVGFANTIAAFNPTDPLLIIFAIAGMIIGGYFIVLGVKAVRVEQERKKAIRLKLNEDVDDDGTN